MADPQQSRDDRRPPAGPGASSDAPLDIKTKAGYEEALYNQDFIQFLQKWSGPILTVVMVVCAGYFAWNWYNRKQAAAQELAFRDFEAARSGVNVNPQTLLDIAEEHASVATIAERARLDAADIYLDSVRRGVKIGTQLGADGSLASPEDALTKEDRESYLSKAGESYAWVAEKAASDQRRVLFAMGGLYGLAAVAETRGNFEEAKKLYERIGELAKSRGYTRHVEVSSQRLATLDALAKMDPVPTRSEVPAVYFEPPPAVAVPEVTPAEAQPEPKVEPESKPDPAPAEDSKPQPQPAPEPAQQPK